MPSRLAFTTMCSVRPFFSTALLACTLLAGCKAFRSQTPEEAIAEAAAKAGQEVPKADAAGAVDVDFLLSMSFNEAAAITTGQSYVPGVARVAADAVDVIKRGTDGNPKRVRAEGHVFLEMTGTSESATALSQEAYLAEDEIILRGRPVLRRGLAMLEGLSDATVFYIIGDQVRALGSHRVRNLPAVPMDSAVAADRLASLKRSSTTGQAGDLPLTVKLPEAGPWRDGPQNSLLPPLDDTAVPPELREELRRQMEAEAVLQKARSGSP
jgi:hypothetical protein